MNTLNGTWQLKDYELKKDGETEFHDDINGLLIFSPDGWFSVSYKYPDAPKQPYKKDTIKNYFFGGKYKASDVKITEESLIHVIDHKVGEKRDVDYSLTNGILTRICYFGEAVLTTRWTRAGN